MSQSSMESGLRHRSSKFHQSRHLLSTKDLMNSERGPEVMHSVSNWANQENGRKTFSRLFVERFLLRFKWYNPDRDRSDRINLKEGWAFYEHVTLARRKIGSKDKEAGLQRALPGETGETELYNYFTTPESSFKDWGVGIALYFSTIRFFAMLLFVGGLISLRNVFYFSSSDYDSSIDRVNNVLLSGSAICNSTVWVECEDKFCDVQMMRNAVVTFAESTTDDKIFVERSACPVDDTNDNDILKAGYWNMAVQVTIILMTIAFSMFQGRQQTIIDEDILTASDYAIQVLNPPKDAYDPDEWRDFFSVFDNDKGVTLVTIILNNAPLLRALKARRYFRKELQRRIPDTDLDGTNLSSSVLSKATNLKAKRTSIAKKLFNITLRPILRIFNMYLDPEVLLKKIKEKTNEVKELQKQNHDVSNVIVTFESESGKRTALEALTASKLAVKRQNTTGKKCLFRGELILDVIEPSEPSAMSYLNLDAGLLKRAIQFSITLSITIGLVALCGYAVARTRANVNSFWAGILTTSFNIIIPFIVRLLLIIETHSREDDRQRSLYIKVTIFRWVNTAIATKFAVPFTSTLGSEKDDLLVGIFGILLAEIWIVPLLAFLDIMGNLNKHYFAPRATVKEHMFLCFKGTYYNLADKYTDITKIIFVCYYYSALNPVLFFLGTAALFVRYCSDKFCLLRLWGTVPNVGTQVAEFSRKYFISFACVAGTVVSAYDWALFNFDRVCDGEGFFEEGTYDVKITSKYGGSSFAEITTNATYTPTGSRIPKARVCNEDRCCQNVGLSWPPIPSEFETEDFKWMTDGQREVTTVFGWFSVVFLIGWIIITFGRTILAVLKSFFIGGFKGGELGKDQDVDFSNLEETDGYIPQIHDPGLTYPLISCDVRGIPQSLIGFLVPGDDDVENYNLINDVPFDDEDENLDDSGRRKKRQVFDIVKHWPYGGK